MKDSPILRSRDWKKERQENISNASPFNFLPTKIDKSKIQAKGFF